MTNQQRAFIKAHAIKTFGLQAAKWNGNELVGREKGDKQWSLIYTVGEAEVALKRVRVSVSAYK